MKLLLDSCLSHRLAEELRRAGHDVVAAAEWLEDPGDARVLQIAAEERRILVTLDTDFGELAVAKGQPHCGIIRIDGRQTHEYAQACTDALDAYADGLMAGGIVVAEKTRLRFRPPVRRA